MRAFGSDRVREACDGRIFLSSRLEKAWRPRAEKTLTSAEFPGTAVLWEEAYYEVVAAEPLPSGGVRYLLLPWREEHVMRLVDQYDADTEAWRIAEHARAVARERGRISANVLGMLTGQLPAAVQRALESETGVRAVRLTLLSILPAYAVAVGIIVMLAGDIVANTDVPPGMILAAGYLLAESTLRFLFAMSLDRPVGSPLGVLVYLIFYALARDRTRLAAPFQAEKGNAAPLGTAPADVALRDAFHMRELFISLLSVEEQRRAAERFGYDYRRPSYLLAGIILAGSLCGIASAVTRGAIIPGILAVVLTTEQTVRLFAFRRGPMPSILGWVVRPLMRKVLG